MLYPTPPARKHDLTVSLSFPLAACYLLCDIRTRDTNYWPLISLPSKHLFVFHPKAFPAHLFFPAAWTSNLFSSCHGCSFMYRSDIAEKPRFLHDKRGIRAFNRTLLLFIQFARRCSCLPSSWLLGFGDIFWDHEVQFVRRFLCQFVLISYLGSCSLEAVFL